MKAVVYTEYGSPDVLQFRDTPQPTPSDNEVLVKVHAVSANSADLHMLRADPFLIRMSSGLLRPKQQILGADIAGTVEAVGGSVTRFKPGDEVFGDISACGFGGFAEYACGREDALLLKPVNLTYEEAAAVPMAAVTALQGLRGMGKIQAGQKALIYGASGGVGTFSVQIAKSFGAEVTAVCSTRHLDMVRSLGADHVIDYTQEDFSRSGHHYDLIVACNGYRPIADYRRVLDPKGIYVMSGGAASQMAEAMLQGPWISMTGTQKMGNLLAKPNTADLAFVKQLLESGKIRPIIDRRYPLSETADALRYLEEGHAGGKVVIVVEPTERDRPDHEDAVS